MRNKFFLRRCVKVEDLEDERLCCPTLFVHHFFPKAAELAKLCVRQGEANLKVIVNFIPTTFEVYIQSNEPDVAARIRETRGYPGDFHVTPGTFVDQIKRLQSLLNGSRSMTPSNSSASGSTATSSTLNQETHTHNGTQTHTHSHTHTQRLDSGRRVPLPGNRIARIEEDRKFVADCWEVSLPIWTIPETDLDGRAFVSVGTDAKSSASAIPRPASKRSPQAATHGGLHTGLPSPTPHTHTDSHTHTLDSFAEGSHGLHGLNRAEGGSEDGTNLTRTVARAGSETSQEIQLFTREQFRENYFGIVHRRLEWMAHFYINAFSNIDLDPRWRIFLFTRPLTDDTLTHTLSHTTSHTSIHTATNKSSQPSAAKLSGKHKLAADKGENGQSFKRSKVGSGSIKEESREGEMMGELEGGSSHHEKTHEKTHEEAKMAAVTAVTAGLERALSNTMDEMACVEIVGFVTVYQFFSLPKDRARISQFFICPQYQGRGLGRLALKAIRELLSADGNIRKVSVEDPSAAFQRLIDVVALERAFDRGLISAVEALGASSPSSHSSSFSRGGLISEEGWKKCSHMFRTLLHETPQERHRLKLILSLAQIVPCDGTLDSGLQALEPYVGAPWPSLTSTAASTTAVTTSQKLPIKGAPSKPPSKEPLSKEPGWLHSEAMRAIRLREKRRLRIESFEWYSQQPRTTTLNELQREWATLLYSCLRSLKTLRQIFLAPAAREAAARGDSAFPPVGSGASVVPSPWTITPSEQPLKGESSKG